MNKKKTKSICVNFFEAETMVTDNVMAALTKFMLLGWTVVLLFKISRFHLNLNSIHFMQ